MIIHNKVFRDDSYTKTVMALTGQFPGTQPQSMIGSLKVDQLLPDSGGKSHELGVTTHNWGPMGRILLMESDGFVGPGWVNKSRAMTLFHDGCPAVGSR